MPSLAALIPPWMRFAAAGLAFLSAFMAGWTVRSWRCDATIAARDVAAATAVIAGVQRADEAASGYEKVRADGVVAARETETIIREHYRENTITVPSDCDVPVAVADSLRGAVERANAAASGQPSRPVPTAAAATNAIDRP